MSRVVWNANATQIRLHAIVICFHSIPMDIGARRMLFQVLHSNECDRHTHIITETARGQSNKRQTLAHYRMGVSSGMVVVVVPLMQVVDETTTRECVCVAGASNL